MSRIGNNPIPFTNDVKIKVVGKNLEVSGKKGSQSFIVHNNIDIELKDNVLTFNRDSIESKINKICEYIEIDNKSFDGFLKWILDLRKELKIPHKLSEVIDEKDMELERLCKMALADPSTSGNPKKLTVNDIRTLYQYSMSGKLF